MSDDLIVRSLTKDRAFRIIAINASTTVATLLLRQGRLDAEGRLAEGASRVELESLARLLVGACLLRHATVPERRVQFILSGPSSANEPVSLVVDSLGDGAARGLIKPMGEVDRGEGTLQVLFSGRNGELHRGVVGVAAEQSIDEALMRYLHDSEQIIATVATEVVIDGSRIRARGYLADVLPDADPAALEAMIARLAAPEQIFAGAGESAGALADAVAGGEPERIAEQLIAFGCSCSAERVLASLQTLTSGDRQELADDGEPVEVLCEACGVSYMLAPEDLRRVADEAQ